MGGDAGSEGESEAEQKELGGHSNHRKNGKSEALPLRLETSALDRPPKAPAMLSLPNEEHEMSHTVFNLSIGYFDILKQYLFEVLYSETRSEVAPKVSG